MLASPASSSINKLFDRSTTPLVSSVVSYLSSLILSASVLRTSTIAAVISSGVTYMNMGVKLGGHLMAHEYTPHPSIK
jgi:hypothetical protein